MVTKTEVTHALLTTIELSLDSLLLVLSDGTTYQDLKYHKKRVDNVGKSLSRLEIVINQCASDELLTQRVQELQAKHVLLVNKVVYKRIA